MRLSRRCQVLEGWRAEMRHTGSLRQGRRGLDRKQGRSGMRSLGQRHEEREGKRDFKGQRREFHTSSAFECDQTLTAGRHLGSYICDQTAGRSTTRCIAGALERRPPLSAEPEWTRFEDEITADSTRYKTRILEHGAGAVVESRREGERA